MRSKNVVDKKVNVVPVVETLPADLLTPLAVYLKISADSRRSFLFESVEGGTSLARYSFVGSDPHMLVRGNDQLVITEIKEEIRHEEISILSYIREHFSTNHLALDPDLPSFSGGAIGSFGFNCCSWFEPTLKTTLTPTPDDVELMFFRTIVAFDHARQLIKIISLVFIDEACGSEEALKQLFDAATKKNRAIKNKLEADILRLPYSGKYEHNKAIRSNFTREQFEDSVNEIKKQIAAGNVYQVVISQRFERRTNVSPISIYRAIRRLDPSPYMFLIMNGRGALIGASPEMLVKCKGEELEYRPIAGTRKRGKTKNEDIKLSEEMLNDPKEVAEHLMLVDLGRNDLGRVAKYGSVQVKKLMSVEKYSHVQHLVSSLTADLREDLDRFDALTSCFPAGTVSGAPKIRAIELISKFEPTDRGLYAGSIGYFDYSGNMDTCIAIRTMHLENGIARIQAGAGIVADSDPSTEYQETVNKASALLGAIDIAEAQYANDQEVAV
ncbi:anthranilate synthase component I family protein [Leptolyngbya sp. 7M]|uniref:anthranilate synthase component I family protein n=1 Tax=Leptolyngbya sp. 7M TaxID=2812896 RepID=UPI001B8D9E37|nr:anthranilate synthase component I family protein [Leptolyngbya sp. 7M]QYO65489.1 anthranilate synthase component I family protein [Leptolyngbya sp. 7M]